MTDYLSFLFFLGRVTLGRGPPGRRRRRVVGSGRVGCRRGLTCRWWGCDLVWPLFHPCRPIDQRVCLAQG